MVLRRPPFACAKVGFTELWLARLEMTCGPDDEASQHLAARCEFVH